MQKRFGQFRQPRIEGGGRYDHAVGGVPNAAPVDFFSIGGNSTLALPAAWHDVADGVNNHSLATLRVQFQNDFNRVAIAFAIADDVAKDDFCAGCVER